MTHEGRKGGGAFKTLFFSFLLFGTSILDLFLYKNTKILEAFLVHFHKSYSAPNFILLLNCMYNNAV